MITLYNQSCLDPIPNLKKNSIDLICCDPPDNISREIHCLDWEKNTISSMDFDKEDDWDTKTDTEYISQLNEWSKIFTNALRPGGQFVSFCADRYISHYW